MIVHLTGNSKGSDDEMLYLRKIVQVVHQQGSEVANNWVETSNHRMKTKSEQDWDWPAIVRDSYVTLDRSDVVIIEATAYALFQGYQLALALDNAKPVLLVARIALDNAAVSGIDNPLLCIKKYDNEEELEQIVKKFLHDFAPKKLDINVKINSNSKLQYYLHEQAQYSGKTESQALLGLAHTGLKVKR